MFGLPRVPIHCSWCHCDTTAWIPSDEAEEVDVARDEIRALFAVTTDDGEGALGWCDCCGATLLFEYRHGTLHLSPKPYATDDRIAEPARSFLHQAKRRLQRRRPFPVPAYRTVAGVQARRRRARRSSAVSSS